MKKYTLFLLISAYFMGCIQGKFARTQESTVSGENQELQQAANAVVYIVNTVFDYDLLKYSEAANGVLISDNGYILTVSHCLSNSIPEVYFGHSRYPARIVCNYEQYDFAILKIDVPFELPYVKFAIDNKMYQKVYVVGKRKRNREVFMSKGIVSAKGINMSSREISWFKTNIREKVKVDYAVQNGILHSAEFFQGLSGCPLLNEYGELIGINTAYISGQTKKITLAQEMICFLPLIGKMTGENIPMVDGYFCDFNVDLENPVLRLGWIMNGLSHYCMLLGKDIDKINLIKNKIEEAARKKIILNEQQEKEVIHWAWKRFLTDAYSIK